VKKGILYRGKLDVNVSSMVTIKRGRKNPGEHLDPGERFRQWKKKEREDDKKFPQPPAERE